MLYKKLYFQVIVRVILILLNVLFLAYIFTLGKFTVTQVNLLLLIIVQTILLIHYLNKTNRDLANFFSSVTNQDSTITFKHDGRNKSYSKLYENLNKVNKLIEQAKIEKIGHYEYLKLVVENIGIGILSYDENDKIQFFNPAGKEILKVNNLAVLSLLDKVYPGLSQKFHNLKANFQQLINVKNESTDFNISVKQVEISIAGKEIKLIAFQNIQSEIDKIEIESWQKIIRVLTHEIMNSVSPIDSASTSITRLYQKESKPLQPSGVNEEVINKTIKGLNIIQQRSKGMLSFVQKFRGLALLSEPVKEVLKTEELFQVVETLFSEQIKSKAILFTSKSTPKNLTIFADKSQIEQVLINIIKNAIESLQSTKKPKISVTAYKNEYNKPVICISDNGKGIKKETLNNIFTPFFTTKTEGSGIGLSLSRQVMYLHGGNITVKSEPNIETTFTLLF